MKTHTNNFKQEIKKFGRQVDSKITIGSTVLRKENLNAVTPSFQGAILKSVMKQLDIDSDTDIPLNSVLNYKFGVKINGEYEYIDFGNYIVYKSEKQEDTSSYKITCYDKMLYSMKEYEDLGITYPITIRDYIKAICDHLGLVFASYNDNFANYDKEIPNELYLGLGYTFRDVFDELSQVTASTVCLNDNDEVEVRYITETNDIIDEEYLKDVNVNFGEKYGKINSIVLSRSGESDNVYLRDEQSVINDGLCELKIIDNQIMNFNNRSDYLPQILNKLNGLEYYLNDFTSTGITYYDVCDRYSVKIGDKTYSCVMFNDEINVTQGLEEIVYTEMPKETETDYTKADKTDRKINQTYIIIDKQNQEIQALASKAVPVSNTIKGVRQIQLENAYEGTLHKLSIKGNISTITPIEGEYGYALMPSETLTPSANLTPSKGVPSMNAVVGEDSILLIDDIEYNLDFKFLNYINDNDCDEFIYEDGKCKIIRRLGVNSSGNLYKLPKEIIEYRKDIDLKVKQNSIIKLKSFDEAIFESTYLLKNEYTNNFATKVETKAEIKVATDEINLEVAKKVGSGDVISAINLSPEQIAIKSDKIALEGYTTINGGFIVDEEGNITTNNATLNKVNITGGWANFTSDDEHAGLQLYKDDNNFSSFYEDLWQQMNNGYYIGVKKGYIECDGDYFGKYDRNGYSKYSYDEVKLENGTDEITINNKNSDPYIQTKNSTSFSSMTPNGIWSPSFNNNSLAKQKKNFTLLENALEIIKNTDIYKYNWQYEDDDKKQHIGFVIGDEYKYSKEITSIDDNNEEIGADIYSMVSTCFKAIKEQQEQIEELTKKLNKLKESDINEKN